jgi:heme A synthase
VLQLTYSNYLVLLLLVTGILVLVYDAKAYKKEQQKKEEKVSRFLGWTNIAFAVLLLVGNWVMQKWIL